MILCAERFAKGLPESCTGIFSDDALRSSLRRERYVVTRDWAARQTSLPGYDTMTLFANRYGRRPAGRVGQRNQQEDM